MDKSRKLNLIKKTASILLVFCFVLPLSKCTTKVKVEKEDKLVITGHYLYGFDMARQGWTALEAGKFNDASTLLLVFNVFFLPIAGLRLKERLQAIVYFASAFLSFFVLYCWVFLLSTTPEIGGLLAIACWMLLFCTCLVTIWHTCRNGAWFASRQLRRSVGQAAIDQQRDARDT